MAELPARDRVDLEDELDRLRMLRVAEEGLAMDDLLPDFALKDAAGNPAETARLIAHAPADFEIYSGDDHVTLPFLAVGAVGMVGVATHWIGERAGRLFDAFEAGNLAEARRINAELLPSFDFETSDEAPNPLPAKALMRALGHPVGQCRLPLGVAPTGLVERASALVAQLGLEA